MDNEEMQIKQMISNIYAAAKQESERETAEKDRSIQSLQEQLAQVQEQLQPLLKFEPVLSKNIKDRLTIQLYELAASEQRTLYAIAREFYPNLSAKHDGKKTLVREPLNQLFSDITAWLLRGGSASESTLALWLKQNKQRGIIINDPI